MVNKNEDFDKTCENCFYFVPNADSGDGLCLRYPPTVFPFPQQSVVGGDVQIMLRMFRPGVRRADRCGEFKQSWRR